MKHRYIRLPLSAAFIWLLSAFLYATNPAADAPTWVKQAAAVKPPQYEKNVNAVVLLNEQNVTLDSNGKLVTVERHAVRILTREGRKEAVALAFYLSNFSQVRDMEAWMIAPDGSVIKSTAIDPSLQCSCSPAAKRIQH